MRSADFRGSTGTDLLVEGADVVDQSRDQRQEFLAQDVVRRLVQDEPGPVVVLRQAFEEFEQGGEVHGRQGGWGGGGKYANRSSGDFRAEIVL